MEAKDIKVGHIYLVRYDKVNNKRSKGEFGDTHLAIVLKKNQDKITYVSVPTTSQKDGIGVNKIDLGKIDGLPDNLKGNHTYAVIDQIGTVSYQRFSALFNNNKAVDVIVPEDKMIQIYRAIIRDLLHDVPTNEILDIFF